MKLSKDFSTNLKKLKETLNSDDVKFCEFYIGKTRAAAVYIDSITDRSFLNEFILRPLTAMKSPRNIEVVQKSLNVSDIMTAEDTDHLIKELLNAKTFIIVDKLATALVVDLKKFEVRAIAEPPTSTAIKGPREGFNESVKTNLSLLRRRIKSPDLVVQLLTFGKYSKTDVAICYVKGIVQKKTIKTLLERLGNIDIDAIPDSSYIAKFLSPKRNSLFKQINTTEKPDVFTMRILEGRVGIIVDGSPIALTAPYMLIEDFQSPEDYYSSSLKATFARFLRLAAITISVLLPGFFVAAQLFHLQLIPLDFLLTIVNSIKGIPLTPSFEMFFVLLIFEMLNEASVRMPKYVGQTVSIVGALVLGETAVRAGIVSTPAILIMALSGVGLYTVPELAEPMSILRLTYLILAGSMGAYGIILGVSFTIAYICSLENFCVPLMAPLAPLIKSDMKDSFYLSFLHNRQFRPQSIGSQNKRRLRVQSKKDSNETN